MSFLKTSAIAGALAFATKVAAHGTVTGIVAENVYYEGYHANFQYEATQPVVVGWSIPEDLNNGFIAPDAYNSSDIICHLAATNAQTSATVAAGDTVQLQWTAWPSSHHGPVIDYLANCNGDCKTVDKTTLEFFKIDGVGLIDDTTVPGTWASDQLIANNNSWTVTIPSDIAPGNYVLRHEIIALHSAYTIDGAQNYPQCVNLEVTGSGTATPSGVLGTALYSETDPGIEINIYQSLSTYIVPGPTLYSGAASISQTAVGSATVTPTTSAGSIASGVASSSPVVTSAASSVASSAAGGVTTIASPSSNFTHFSNSTMTSSKKSACKAKTTSSSALLATSSVDVAAVSTSVASLIIPTSSPGVVATSEATSSVEVVEAATIVPVAASTTSSAATASETASGVAEPEGTTLGDLLSWLSAFYKKFAGTSYNGNTVARRHPRALQV